MELPLQDLAMVLALALLPAAGNFGGGLLAEFVSTSGRGLSRALHGAAGIVIAVVAVEIMPGALPVVPGWALTIAFVLGGCFYLAVDAVVDRVQQKRSGTGAESGTAWMIYFAVSMDLFSDGLLIGAGSAASSSLALALAVGQVLADVPEGFATIVNFKNREFARARRIALSASFAIPALTAAALAFLLLREQTQALQMSAVVFTAAPIVIASVEDMLREAHESAEDTRVSVVCFIGGFALFLLVSTLFEG
jgi:zinc transporter, ZIP family